MIAMLVAAGLVFAQEHTAPALAADAPAVRGVPAGEPQQLIVHPGDDLDARIAALPAHSTVVLTPGVYAGPVLVDRPLTLRGEAGAELVGPGRGTVLAIFADDVQVSGITVRGSGLDTNLGDSGIRVTGARVVIEDVQVREVLIGLDLRMARDGRVERVKVQGPTDGPMGMRGDGLRLWESTGNVVRDSVFDHVRDLVVWYSSGNLFEEVAVHDSRYGVHFMHSDDNVVRNSRLVDDVVGVFSMYSRGIRIQSNTLAGADGAAGMGFGCKESDLVEFLDNRVIANNTGLYIDNCPQRLGGAASVKGNLFAYNRVGLRFHYVREGLTIEGNEIYENARSASVDGNATAALARVRHNRWSDYEGYDLDADGLGDLPYQPAALTTSLWQKRPVATYFAGTPAAMLLDFVGALFPMFLPPAVLTDPAPRLGRR